MLTPELLKQIEGLTDDQISKIAKLSENDENDVLAKKVREIHDQYDSDIKEITGLAKQTNQKTYDFLKEVLGNYKSEKDELNTKLQTAIDAKKELETKLKDGKADEALKQQLTDAQTTIKSLRDDLKKKDSEFQGKISEKETELQQFKFSSIQELANVGLKFKKEFAEDERALNYFKKGAIDDAMKLGKPEIMQVNGRNEIIFRDENGTIITDDENLREPLTFSAAYKKNLSNVLDSEPGKGGTGKKSNTAVNVFNGTFASKKEATQAISEHLIRQGYEHGKADYQEQMDKLCKEIGFSELPMDAPIA